jgi:hypothetical protein
MVKLPNGAKLAFSTVFGAVKQITGITNANPGVASSADHGLEAGAILLLESGWEGLDLRAARVAAPAADTFSLEGINTTDLVEFPAALGVGTAREVDTWVGIDQVIGTAAAGGDQQYWTYSPLDSQRSKQLPTERSPQTMTLTLGDDPNKPWYAALDAADKAGDTRILRCTLKGGQTIYYAGIVSFNKTPTLVKGEGMAVTASLAINSEITRYAA